MKLINQNTLNNIASNSASYIALGTNSKQLAWKMMLQAGFSSNGGKITNSNGEEYMAVETRSGEIAFKRVQ